MYQSVPSSLNIFRYFICRPPARYVLTRLPDKLAAHPLSQALLHLLAATSEREYKHIYLRAESLFRYVQQSDFLYPKLGEVAVIMIKSFVASFQERTIKLLSRAFTSLPLSLAQTYLDFPTNQLLEVTEKHGWTYNASNQTLSPAPIQSTTATSAHVCNPSSLNTFNHVAESTAKLEI